MTVKEKIMSIVDAPNQDGYDMDIDDWRKLVAMAYYIGRESAVREISDMYNAHIAEQKKRADACRYSHMAHAVVGEKNYLYHPDYCMEMTTLFGSDETNL